MAADSLGLPDGTTDGGGAAPRVLPDAPPGQIAVQVCFADVSTIWQRDVRLPEGSTVATAIDASGFRGAYPNVDPAVLGVGIYGKAVPLTTRLQPHDRIEIYRALRFDPKDSRRRRADHRARRLRQERGG